MAAVFLLALSTKRWDRVHRVPGYFTDSRRADRPGVDHRADYPEAAEGIAGQHSGIDATRGECARKAANAKVVLPLFRTLLSILISSGGLIAAAFALASAPMKETDL